MFKFSYGVLTAATIAAAIEPAFAQQPSPPAQAAASDTGQSAAPAGAHAYFQNLKNGDTVTSPFKVLFGLSANMGVGPSGIEKLALNPFFDLLEIVRGPILGSHIAATTWMGALVYSVVLCAISWAFFVRARGRVTFWV